MNRPLLRRALGPVLGLVVMVLLVLWMSGAFEQRIAPGLVARAPRHAPADATVVTLRDETVPVVEEAAGTVQAARRTLVSARILATIRAIPVRAGDEVNAGDVVVELDDRELRARVAEAERQVEGARAARRKSAADFGRAQQLLRQGVVSRSEYDRMESAAKVADADLARGEETLQAAKVALSYARILAPVTGRVVDRLAEPGDTAAPGKPLLALYDPRSLRMEVPVRESLLGHLAVGDPLEVRVGDAVVHGVVDEIVPEAQAGSHSVLVKIGLPREQGIYTGMFGRVRIPAGTRHRTVVPAGSVERVGQLTYVTTVEDDGTLARRLVTLGPKADDGWEVLSGLRPGDRVLVGASDAG
jgi:membrane fusion protein (multidrug efflux system)